MITASRAGPAVALQQAVALRVPDHGSMALRRPSSRLIVGDGRPRWRAMWIPVWPGNAGNPGAPRSECPALARRRYSAAMLRLCASLAPPASNHWR